MTPVLKHAYDALVLAAFAGLGALYASWQFFRLVRWEKHRAALAFGATRPSARVARRRRGTRRLRRGPNWLADRGSDAHHESATRLDENRASSYPTTRLDDRSNCFDPPRRPR